MQSLPRLFSGVTEFSKPDERNAALSALSSIDSLFRNNRKRVHGEVVRQSRLAPSSVQESLKRSQRQVQQVKLRLGLQMDDKAFQLMINESGVSAAASSSASALTTPGITLARSHQVELRRHHGPAPRPASQPQALRRSHEGDQVHPAPLLLPPPVQQPI